MQIGLELTIVPQLQSAADELVTLQQYNQQWTQIRDRATTETERSEAEAAIRQNAGLIEERSKFIQANRPKVEQFYQARTQFVQQQLETALTTRTQLAQHQMQVPKTWVKNISSNSLKNL